MVRRRPRRAGGVLHVDLPWLVSRDAAKPADGPICAATIELCGQQLMLLNGEVIGSLDRTRAQQAIDAMLQMQKLDIAGVQAAYDR